MRLYTLALPWMVVMLTLLPYIWVEGHPHAVSTRSGGPENAALTHIIKLKRRTPTPFLRLGKLVSGLKGLLTRKKNTNTNPPPNNPHTVPHQASRAAPAAPAVANGAHPPVNNAVAGATAETAATKTSKMGLFNAGLLGLSLGTLPSMFSGGDSKDETAAAGTEVVPSSNPSAPYDSQLAQQGYTNPSQTLPYTNQQVQAADVNGNAYVDPSASQYYANQGNPVTTYGATTVM
ncbi:hypothetical protein IWQ62_000621 [Dispira parvispora]|uniref:Uncharacterized protein n=1 Tax=Dispira parvispora TaxID=1520584 RepID=A0A9W8B086_9FUNG|nr:hypothetical protein IWQ62_000621 [Dispira parvispora]